MKAIVYKKFGPPGVLQVADIPRPVPRKHEILIAVHATTVTAEDPKMRSGNHPALLKIPVGLIYGFRKPRKPVPGMEFAGTVAETGSAVGKFKPGDRVFGYTGLGFGAAAEYLCMPESGLLEHMPRNLSFEQAATLVNGPLSALVFLHKKGRIKAGERVLVYGASGSVGTAAVQLAKHFGAGVTAVCSGKNAGLVRSLGAREVLDYTLGDFNPGPGPYDMIFDTVGKTRYREVLPLLREGGRYVLSEFSGADILRSLTSAVFGSRKVIVASSNFSWRCRDLALFRQLAESGDLVPVIDRSYALEDIATAHAYVEEGHKAGNVAVRVVAS